MNPILPVIMVALGTSALDSGSPGALPLQLSTDPVSLAQSATDTVQLAVHDAFERALSVSPEIQASTFRAAAARNRAGQAEAWPNPGLNVNAENLGRQQELTGFDGFEGTEGQAVFTTDLPFGWERSGEVGLAGADARVASAQARLASYDASVDILTAMGGLLRDQVLANSAREEHQTLTRLAEALALQAREGRASAGDAARAELARGLAATRLARRESALAVTATDVARRLGYAPEMVVLLRAPACVTPDPLDGEQDTSEPLAELEIASARFEAAEAAVTLARGTALPDVQPQIGWRRVGGLNALYLGLSTSLPLFDRGQQGLAAAAAELEAVSSERAAVETALAARREAARRTLEALDAAGRGFRAGWFEALERTVLAAEARYELGEGTLFELLDSRRARLQALDDYAEWQAEWWSARADLARLNGLLPDADLLCTDPYRENR